MVFCLTRNGGNILEMQLPGIRERTSMEVVGVKTEDQEDRERWGEKLATEEGEAYRRPTKTHQCYKL